MKYDKENRVRDYRFEGEKIPAMFSTPVIMRMFGDDTRGMKDFLQKYKDSRRHSATPHAEPSGRDYKIADAFRLSPSYTKVASMFNITQSQAVHAVNRVARYKFLNS